MRSNKNGCESEDFDQRLDTQKSYEDNLVDDTQDARSYASDCKSGDCDLLLDTQKSYEDDLVHDPQDAENLLSKEILKLSLSDRNAIQEEMHGVRCLAPEESPDFLERHLNMLKFELPNLPLELAKGYRDSQTMFPKTTHVNTDQFRLRFLRQELFDVKKAARRLASYLNLARELFGDYALERPIRLSDFTKTEQKYMRKGRVQWLPFRDRSGRRICVILNSHDFNEGSPKIQAKICLYMSYTAANDVDAQRKGIVVIVWFDKAFRMNDGIGNKPRLHEVTMIRVCALHLCTPDTPVYRFRRAVTTMRVARFRKNYRSHIGSTVELNYILQGYGIPTETIPVTYTGTIKTKGASQWMRVRAYLEEPLYKDTQEVTNVVECPYPNDIVFRQGVSMQSHQGNASFRALVAIKFSELENRLGKMVDKKSKNGFSNKYKIRVIIQEVMEESQRANRRFLLWDEAQCCWKILIDEDLIYTRIESMVREHRSATKAQRNQQKNHCSTSMFCESKQHQRGSCCE